MELSIITAMAENRVIGRAGAIPWELPDDRRRFRELTMGHPVIMGRKTFESIGRPLSGRENIILSRKAGFSAPGCIVRHDLQAALAVAGDSDEIFICGGSEVYREALPFARRIYLTLVHLAVDGDAFFPEIPEDFREVDRQAVPGEIQVDFLLLERQSDCRSAPLRESA